MFSFRSRNSINHCLRRAVLSLFLVVGTLTGCQQVSLVVSPEEAAEGVIGKIAWVRDKAYAFQPGVEKGQIFKGNAVYSGQWIETDRRSSVAVFLRDGAKVYLGESARLLIDDYAYNPASRLGTADYKLSVGSMRFISGDMPASGVSIETPTTTIGFSGSDALIFVMPSGETIVNVFEGEFIVRESDGETGTRTGPPEARDTGVGTETDAPDARTRRITGAPGTPGARDGGARTNMGAPGTPDARNGGGREETVIENENISVSPTGEMAPKVVGTKYPDGSRDTGGPPRTPEAWESTPPDERDDIPRDWTGDVKILDPGVPGVGDPGVGVAGPLHEGDHGDGGGGHPPPGHHNGGDHMDDHDPGDPAGPDHGDDHGDDHNGDDGYDGGNGGNGGNGH